MALRILVITAWVIAGSPVAYGCGRSTEPSPIDASSRTDGGADSGSDAGGCAPDLCDLFCEHGFARGPDGCEICMCNPPPDDSCSDESDCVLAYDSTSCCACTRGVSGARVDGDPCLIERGQTPPPGCAPDPMLCATVDCAVCEPVVRAICLPDNTCGASGECPAGQVQFNLTCVPACESHADCTLAAHYGNCCGGCSPAPRSQVDADACLAERQSESTCSPAPGACDGLGCASPPLDCTAAGEGAVCMADGNCQYAAAGGACPTGSSDVDGVCVPD